MTTTKELDPQVVQLHGAAVALMKAGQHTTALIMLLRARAIDPAVMEVHEALGTCFAHLNRLGEAEQALECAVTLDETNAQSLCNRGLLRTAQHHYNGAAADYVKAHDMWAMQGNHDKDALGAQWNHAISCLKAGQWELGLALYETRTTLRGPPQYFKFACPQWNGEPLDDLTLFVAQEQGLGDRVMVSRLFAVIKDRWPTAHVVTNGDAQMQNLLWEFQLEGIVDVLPVGAPINPFGLHYACYAMSMLRCLNIRPDNIPPDPGLILRRAQDQALRVPPNLPAPLTPGALKVGFAWTGNPVQQENAHRSAPLHQFLSLAENPRVMLYSLQVGPQAQQLRDIGGQTLAYPLGEEIAAEGYVGGATAMLDLDLIVTVCTGTAHLGGALSVPTWVLLNTDHYWAWQPYGPAGASKRLTPWYPSVRLFHQPSPGDWDSVFDEVRAELARLAPMR